jgi:hypothetical protein
MLLLAAIAIVKVIRRIRAMTLSLLLCSTAWICYQTQSLISINQVGLALWGWVLTGALIAYERATRGEQVEETAGIPSKGAKVKANSSASGSSRHSWSLALAQ